MKHILLEKLNIKSALLTALFWALFLVLFIVLSVVFASAQRPVENGMESRITQAYRGEDFNSVDVIFIGNSDI